jgi:hypothetical protein
MRRSLAIILTGGLLLLGPLALAGGASAATTIAPTTTCGNDIGNGGGQGLICEVTIVNQITASGGSATVTVRECQGAAGPPATQTNCTNKTTNLTKPVTAVTQCNSSLNGGGATLRCSVKVTNNFVGLSPGATAATVNQCVGSGSITTGCDPFPATTTGAAITQCNGSAGGGNLVELTCAATGTMASALGVTINQCNGSANGGGALVICSANITNAAAATTGSTKLTFTGSTAAAPGASLTLRATLKTSAGVAIAGQTVTFTLNGVTLSAKTSRSGLASVVTKAPTALGTYPIKIAFAGNTTRAAASTTATLRVRVATLPNTATLATTDVPGSGPTPVVFVGILLLAFVVASRLALRPIRTR